MNLQMTSFRFYYCEVKIWDK